MIAGVLATMACLAAGLAATWYLHSKRLPSERRIAGRALLAAMDHADFMQLVLAVLNGRGFERTFGGGGTEGEYLVERHGRGWLLSSRYSHAYTPDSTAIAEFSSYLRHRGVPGGVLAIHGRFPRAAFGVARAHRIELLDSDNMWDELQPLLDDRQHAAIERPARARLKWLFVLAWIAAIAIGVVVYLGGRQAESRGDAMVAAMAAGQPGSASLPPGTGAGATGAANAVDVPDATGVPDTAGVPNAAAAADTGPAARTAAAPASVPATDPSASIPIAERRNAIAKAVGRLPHVRGATWPAPSTLQVVVDSEAFDPRSLCPLIEHDHDLGTSRLQVQYPTSRTRPVRFLQCRAY